MQATIYGLCDPITGQLRYVGKANDVGKRLRGHLRNRSTKTPVCRWIAKLKRNGHAPELFEIERTDNWADSERFWIAYFRSIGAALLNLSPGGNEPGAEASRRAAFNRENGPNAELNKHLRNLGQIAYSALREANKASGALRAQLMTSAYIIRFKYNCVRALL